MKVTNQKAIKLFNMRINILATFRNLPAMLLSFLKQLKKDDLHIQSSP